MTPKMKSIKVTIRRTGNVLVLSLLMVTLFSAMATAFYAVTAANSRQSGYVFTHEQLRNYAETGIRLSFHELMHGTGGGDGNIGTQSWTTANDLGKDGLPGTSDEGEGDGLATAGELNVTPAYIGPTAQGIRLFSHCYDTAWANVKRIVATAYTTNAQATREVYVRGTPPSLPGVGAAFVPPGVVLDLNGNSFRIDGTDHNPDGTSGPAATVYGLATAIGSPAGSNRSALVSQVPAARADQIIGQGSSPSIGEVGGVDLTGLFDQFANSPKTTVPGGTYSSVSWGSYAANNYQVTYSPGDLHLSGNGGGAGVLLVEGSLTMSGRFDFVGLVLVKGDVRLTGGGAGVHIYGSLVAGQTLTAVDPDTFGLAGSADLYYSSVGLANAAGLMGMSYSILHWADLR